MYKILGAPGINRAKPLATILKLSQDKVATATALRQMLAGSVERIPLAAGMSIKVQRV